MQKAIVQLALLVVFAVSASRAQYCPDCEVNYDACAATCYKDVGYKPLCVAYYIDGNPKPDNEMFVSNDCAAECYFKAYQGLRRFDYYEKGVNTPKTSSSCEDEWKIELAANYAFRAGLGQYQSILAPPEKWVSDVIDSGSDDFNAAMANLTSGIVQAIPSSCFVCDGSDDKEANSASAPEPSAAPVPAPAPDTASSPPLVLPTPIPAPVPAPVVPVPVPAPAPVVVIVVDAVPEPSPVEEEVVEAPEPSVAPNSGFKAGVFSSVAALALATLMAI